MMFRTMRPIKTISDRWYSEQVILLRRIHLSVVLASAGLLIAAFALPPRSAHRALNELETLTGLFETIPLGWYQEAKNRMEDDSPLDISQSPLLGVRESPVSGAFTIQNPVGRLYFPPAPEGYDAGYMLLESVIDHGIRDPGLPAERPRDLELEEVIGFWDRALDIPAFVQIWDWSTEVLIINAWEEYTTKTIPLSEIEDELEFDVPCTLVEAAEGSRYDDLALEICDLEEFPVPPTSDCLEFRSYRRLTPFRDGPLGLDSETKEFLFTDYALEMIGSKPGLGRRLLIGVNGTPVGSLLGLYLDAKGSALPHASFQIVFPNLVSGTQGNQNIKLGPLRMFFEQQLATQSEQLVVWGLKIPETAITRVGGLLLLTVQLYFLLHLRELAQHRPDSGDEWAGHWIGVYPGRSARVATVITACLLPLTTAFILHVMIPGASGAIRLSFGVVVGALSAAVAILTARTLSFVHPHSTPASNGSA